MRQTAASKACGKMTAMSSTFPRIHEHELSLTRMQRGRSATRS
jgi:hypothetical protein